jgi:hypothetical protein
MKACKFKELREKMTSRCELEMSIGNKEAKKMQGKPKSYVLISIMILDHLHLHLVIMVRIAMRRTSTL